MQSNNIALAMMVWLLCLQAGAAAFSAFGSQSEVVQEQAGQPCHDDNPAPLVGDESDCCDSRQNCAARCGMAGCQSILAAASIVNFYHPFSPLGFAPAPALPQVAPDALFRPPATA